jgi:hypothetical protein
MAAGGPDGVDRKNFLDNLRSSSWFNLSDSTFPRKVKRKITSAFLLRPRNIFIEWLALGRKSAGILSSSRISAIRIDVTFTGQQWFAVPP